MLDLKLRDEFLGAHMPGTAIALRKGDNTGAAQQSPDYILSITYPTADVQTALRQIGTRRAGRPIVLMGDRGRGKSHIMAVMHHAIESSEQVQVWVKEWGQRLQEDSFSNLELEHSFKAISEPVHNHEYPLLWDLLFDRHPKGEFYRGKFQQMKQPYPPRSLLEEMFESQPVALILDEFQKWFDGLHDETGATGQKWRQLASNIIQNLSEIAKDRPEILILVISVLNNETEAFRQVHRNEPVLIDFRGPTAKQDRQKMVLHRLFVNRDNIPDDDISNLASAYAQERFRLKFSHLPETERSQITLEVMQSWPFSPELMQLLEEQILMAEAAQEARDLIRILAHAYRARGENVPLITPADFFVDEDAGGVQSLLDSIATAGAQEKLREVAQNNLELIQSCGEPIPHAKELVSALWMRSMSPGRTNGGTRHELQLDITRDKPLDDNAFNGEIVSLIDNSKNIHGEETVQGRLRFEIGENPRSLVRATAKNDRLWQAGADENIAGQMTYPGADTMHIRDTLRHILVPEAREPVSRVIVLGPNWQTEPWTEVEENDKPNRWDRSVIIVVPASFHSVVTGKISDLGKWLAENVPVKRNTIRFLIASGDKGLFDDIELRFLARCSYLTSKAWRDDPKYLALKRDFDTPLRNILKARYDRFAVLRRWDYQNPENCVFDVERIGAQGAEIASAIESKLRSDLFDPAEFNQLILRYAQNSATVGEILDEISEPPASLDTDAIHFLGATQIYEEILKIAAKGSIVLNVDGNWIARSSDHQDEEEAFRYIRSKAFRSDQEMRRVQLGLPGATGGSTVTGPAVTRPERPQPVGGQPVTTPPGGLFGGDVPEGGGLTPGGTVITPGGTRGVPTLPQAKIQRSEEANIGINLCGYFEKWGIDPSTTLKNAKIEFANLTAQQIKQILQRLPSAFRASLEISYDEEESS